MGKIKKGRAAREEMLNNKEKEYVIMNSPDDYQNVTTGDEESIVAVDNPDDVDAGYRQK